MVLKRVSQCKLGATILHLCRNQKTKTVAFLHDSVLASLHSSLSFSACIARLSTPHFLLLLDLGLPAWRSGTDLFQFDLWLIHISSDGEGQSATIAALRTKAPFRCHSRSSSYRSCRVARSLSDRNLSLGTFKATSLSSLQSSHPSEHLLNRLRCYQRA